MIAGVFCKHLGIIGALQDFYSSRFGGIDRWWFEINCMDIPTKSIIARARKIRYSNEHTPKGIEIAFRKVRSFRGGRGTRGRLQLPGFKRLAQ